MKAFGLKNSNLVQGFKSAILVIFQRDLGWRCPVSTRLKKALIGINSFGVRFLEHLKG